MSPSVSGGLGSGIAGIRQNGTRQRLVERPLRAQGRAVESHHGGVERIARRRRLIWQRRYAALAALHARQRQVRPERSLLGPVPAARLQRGRRGRLQGRGASFLVLQIEREESRVARWQRANARWRQLRRRAGGERAEGGLRNPRRGGLVLPAEEHERHVQCLGRNGSEIDAPGDELIAPRGNRRARRVRQVPGQEQAPPRTAHPGGTRRSRCMATVVERSRMSALSPGSSTVRVIERPSVSCTLQQTVPTGFSSLPPSGPAMPVTATAVSAPNRFSAPAAMASATGSDTAPCSLISRGSTWSSSTFASLAYATPPPATYADDPGRSVSRAASSPAVHDSAVASRRPASRRATRSSTREPSSEKMSRSWRSCSSSTSSA